MEADFCIFILSLTKHLSSCHEGVPIIEDVENYWISGQCKNYVDLSLLFVSCKNILLFQCKFFTDLENVTQ